MSGAVRYLRCLLALLPLALTAGCATGGPYPGLAWSGGDPAGLDGWIETELEPYLEETLTTHPRFRGETITVVAMQGDDPTPVPDALSAALASRISGSLLAMRGVELVWDGGRAAGDCLRREDAHYVLAVDLQQTSPASHRLSIRALDREEGLWVSGFGRQWDGRLTRHQYSAFKRRAETDSGRGLRDDPFDAGETDLMAERLAAALGERFCGFVGEPLVVFADVPPSSPAVLRDTVGLVANNLARSPHIRVVGNAAEANLVLTGRLYVIDGRLHQLWVQARPADGQSAFEVTDVEAYVELPRQARASSLPVAADPPAEPPRVVLQRPAPEAPAIGAMAVLTPNDPWMCSRADPWRRGARVLGDGEALDADDCFALELEVNGDAEVFLLRRDADAGLVRMLPARCGRHGRVSSRLYDGGTLRFPSPAAGWEHALSPPTRSLRDAWIAVVLAPDGAPALRRHLARVPDDCAARDGARVDAETWLDSLDDLAAADAIRVSVRRLELSVGRRSAALE